MTRCDAINDTTETARCIQWKQATGGGTHVSKTWTRREALETSERNSTSLPAALVINAESLDGIIRYVLARNSSILYADARRIPCKVS
jgi:hypothetical protein